MDAGVEPPGTGSRRVTEANAELMSIAKLIAREFTKTKVLKHSYHYYLGQPLPCPRFCKKCRLLETIPNQPQIGNKSLLAYKELLSQRRKVQSRLP